MKHASLLTLGTLASTTLALQATTTRYYDGQKGACGCGPASGSSLFSWQLGISTGVYTAAGSQALFDASGSTWCGSGCGACYKLTSTGNTPCGIDCGNGGVAGQSIIVMVTNLCPNNGNAVWCPAVGGTNEYGYSYHFDIMAQSEIFGDNVVVDFEPVACPGQAVSDFEQCQCPLGAAPSLPGSSTPPSTAQPPPAQSSPASSGGGVVAEYGQCGGATWTGGTQCAAGTTCKVQNQYYSQCLT